MAMKKSYLIAICVTVAAILWIASGAVAPSEPVDRTDAAKTETAVEKQLVEVRVRSSVAAPVTGHVSVTGRSHASRSVDVKAETEGQVVSIFSEKGTTVTEGQVIAELEERDRKARVDEAKERLAQRDIEYKAAKSLQDKGFNSKVRLAQAAADLEEARAVLKQAEVDYGNTKIKAPFDGVIFEQSVEIGDFVRSGDMIYSIVDLDPIELHGFVTEQQIRHIKQGKQAKAVFVSGAEVEGTVSYTAPAANAATRTFAIEISVENPDYKIIDGMTAQIMVPTEEQNIHTISPAVLSLNDEGQVGVKIVDDQDKVLFMPVSIIEDKPDHMLVAGLPDKVRLITVGQEFVVPGQKVKPVVADGDGLL